MSEEWLFFSRTILLVCMLWLLSQLVMYVLIKWSIFIILQFCRKVWLGLHDKRVPLDCDLKDENRMRDLMTQRYENKRWYVAPTEALYEEAKRQNAVALTKPSGTKPLSTLVGSKLPALAVKSNEVQTRLRWIRISIHKCPADSTLSAELERKLNA